MRRIFVAGATIRRGRVGSVERRPDELDKNYSIRLSVASACWWQPMMLRRIFVAGETMR